MLLYAQRLISSPPKQQVNDVCGICGGMHATSLQRPRQCHRRGMRSTPDSKGAVLPLLQKRSHGEELCRAAQIRGPQLQKDARDAPSQQKDESAKPYSRCTSVPPICPCGANSDSRSSWSSSSGRSGCDNRCRCQSDHMTSGDNIE